jgi:glycerophosphoryl diester phosphodiesterase
VRLGLLCELNEKQITRIINLGNSFLNVHYNSVKKSLVKKANSKGIEVECWTVNRLEVLQDLINKGITGITTDKLSPENVENL